MFGGAHPFSEPQSRMIARLALSGGVPAKAYLNVHSGEWAAYSGWDSKGAVGPGLPVSAGPCFGSCGVPLASWPQGVLVHVEGLFGRCGHEQHGSSELLRPARMLVLAQAEHRCDPATFLLSFDVMLTLGGMPRAVPLLAHRPS